MRNSAFLVSLRNHSWWIPSQALATHWGILHRLPLSTALRITSCLKLFSSWARCVFVASILRRDSLQIKQCQQHTWLQRALAMEEGRRKHATMVASNKWAAATVAMAQFQFVPDSNTHGILIAISPKMCGFELGKYGNHFCVTHNSLSACSYVLRYTRAGLISMLLVVNTVTDIHVRWSIKASFFRKKDNQGRK